MKRLFTRPPALPLIILLMAMPWFWAWLGLHAISDYRVTIALYAGFGCVLPSLLPIWDTPLKFRPLGYSRRLILLWILISQFLIHFTWGLLSPVMLADVDLANRIMHSHFDFDAHYWGFLLYFI